MHVKYKELLDVLNAENASPAMQTVESFTNRLSDEDLGRLFYDTVVNGNLFLTQCLLYKGAQADGCSEDRKSAFLIAAEKGFVDIIDLMVDTEKVCYFSL